MKAWVYTAEGKQGMQGRSIRIDSWEPSRSEQKREGWLRSTFDHRNQPNLSLNMPGASLSHQVWRQAANGERRGRPKPFAESPNRVLLWFPRQNRRWQRPQWFRSQRILRLCVGPFGPLDQMRRLCITGFTFHGRHWCKRTLIKSGWGVPRCQSATVWVWMRLLRRFWSGICVQCSVGFADFLCPSASWKLASQDLAEELMSVTFAKPLKPRTAPMGIVVTIPPLDPTRKRKIRFD